METQKKHLKHLKNLSVGSSIISAEKPKSLETQEIKATPFKALQTKYFPSCIPLNLDLMKLEKENTTVKGSLLTNLSFFPRLSLLCIYSQFPSVTEKLQTFRFMDKSHSLAVD